MNINLTQSVKEIQSGKVIAYPTEAVYGLGCDPFNQQAFNDLLALKNRPISKGVILVAANIEQIKSLVKIENEVWTEQILASWQNKEQAITWVIPTTNKVPNWLTGGRNTLAVRITHHIQIKKLCNLLNSPIVSTSANLSQQLPIKTAEKCLQTFPNTPILEGKISGLKHTSQIWDAETIKQLR